MQAQVDAARARGNFRVCFPSLVLAWPGLRSPCMFLTCCHLFLWTFVIACLYPATAVVLWAVS